MALGSAMQRIGIKVDADTLSASQSLKKLNATLGDSRNAVKRADTATGQWIKAQRGIKSLVSTYASVAAGAIAVGTAVWTSVKAYAEAEAVQVRLERAVANAGQTYSAYDDRIQKVISAQSRLAAVDDELVAGSLATLVQATGDVNKALELNTLALDLSRAKGKDLASTSTVIAKVYKGNVGALKRYGVTVKEGATATEALGELQKKYAGYAEDYGNSVAGSADRMTIAWGNLQEAGGKLAVETFHVDQRMNGLSDRMNEVANGGAKELGKAFIDLTGPSIIVNTVMGMFRGEVEKTDTKIPQFTASVKSLKQQYDEYAASVDEATSALAASQDAELASLRADQKVVDAKKNLKEVLKKHKDTSREAKIATLELKIAEREQAAAAELAKDKVAALNSANQRLADNKPVLEYLEQLRKKLRLVGNAGATAARRIQSIQNPNTASGGVRANAAGSIVTSPTLTWVGEAGDDEAIIPINSKPRSYDLLAKTMQRMGVGGGGGATYNISVGTGVNPHDVRMGLREALLATQPKGTYLKPA